jgi:hypothetical protein
MTSSHLYVQARSPLDVPWDRARERRVLGRALEAKRRRARRRMAFELVAAMAVTFVAGRALPHASAESGEAQPAIAPATEETRGTPVGGFAGTGGHGGTGSRGQGGNAGTG